ncbi:MAG: tRNA pseudouridine(13) synthase TruD [Ectothiorhodospiraceae bacterium]|nr:tRNA pseudouridine(13) synthase TruD [Ectothiorhodospiraceae bacterium]
MSQTTPAEPPPVDPWIPFDALPFAHGGPVGEAVSRASPEDFEVEEILGWVPDGDGGHAMLWVEKRGANTEWVAGRLAALAGARSVDVGFAGLKDRHAVTRQWFTVDLRGRPEPDWSALDVEGVRVLEATRTRRKLRRGSLRGNRFRIVLRRCTASPAAMADRLDALAALGAPSYFGPQRFGRDGANVDAARAALTRGGRPRLRAMVLSAARSVLFNRVLAARVAAGTWARVLPGERAVLDGSRSHFAVETVDADIVARVAAADVHPSGPLWGAGAPSSTAEAAAAERAALTGCECWCAGLEAVSAEERRALRVSVRDLDHAWSGPDLTLAFSLGAGAYATAVLREIVRDVEAAP